jgi:hypothetical protein
VEGADELSVINVPINKQLREVKERPIGVDTLKQIRDHITVSKADKGQCLEGCRLSGAKGEAWEEVQTLAYKPRLKKIGTEAPAERAEDSAADVLYIMPPENNMPLVIGVPCAGMADCAARDAKAGAAVQVGFGRRGAFLLP